MRKVILIIIMILLIALLGYSIYSGIFKVPSYSDLGDKSAKLNSQIETFNKKNNEELPGRQKVITAQIAEYSQTKEEYETILEEKRSNLLTIDSANCYDVDFLWTKIGNYATNRGLDMTFNITKNVSDSGRNEYVLTDLNFSVIGEYNEIADFVNEIEKDSRLEFEIRDFNMKMITIGEGISKKQALNANFVVYGVAINKGTLTDLSNTANAAAQAASSAASSNAANTNTTKPATDTNTTNTTSATNTTTKSDN